MGLDITFTRRKNFVCPKCGEVVGHTDMGSVDAGGRGWYPLLESLGYYVPYEQRTEENNWCGKDMVLTDEQIDEVYRFAQMHDLFGSAWIPDFIVAAQIENESIMVNADW